MEMQVVPLPQQKLSGNCESTAEQDTGLSDRHVSALLSNLFRASDESEPLSQFCTYAVAGKAIRADRKKAPYFMLVYS